MNALEELHIRGIERCPECNCAVGDDWDYKDFSNKTIVVCPQCGEEINLLDYPQAPEENGGNTVTVRDRVEHLVNAGYVRQALDKSSACMGGEEINWIMDAVKIRLRRHGKKKGGR